VKSYKKAIFNLTLIIMIGIIALLPVITIFAVPSYGYYTDITITNTSGTARTNIGVTTAVNVTALNSAGYINATGTDTQIENAGSQVLYGLANDKVNIFTPSLAGFQSQTYRMYLDYSPVVGDGARAAPYNTNFPIIPGDGGYVTTTDNAALEPGNNFNVTFNDTFVDTATAGNILTKSDLTIASDGAGNITASIGNTGNPLIQVISGGHTSNPPNNYYNGVMGGTTWNVTENTVYQVVPTTGTFSNLRIRASGNIAGGATKTFTLVKNGTPGALSAVMAAGTSTASDLANSMTFAAGDTISLKATETGVPGALAYSWSVVWTSSIAGESILMWGAGIANNGANYYTALGGDGVSVTTEAYSSAPIPTAGTFKKLYVQMAADPGTAPDNYRYYLRKNTANTSLTTNIVADATIGNDTTNTVAVVAGDTVSIACNFENTPAIITTHGGGIVFVSNTVGEAINLVGSTGSSPSNVGVEYMGVTPVPAAWNATEANMYQLGQATVLSKFYAVTSVAPGGVTSYTMNLRSNAGNTGITVTVSGAATTGSDLVNTYTVPNGNVLDIQSTPSGAPPALGVYRFGYVSRVAGASVSGAATAAEHDFSISQSGGTLTLTIDGSALDTDPAVTVKNDATNFVWLSNITPYIGNIVYSVGGVEQLRYKPVAIISGTTLIDETNAYDGTITWGANSNITVTFSGITSYATQVPVVSSSGNVVTLNDVNSPATWYGTTANLTNLPFYYSFNQAATNMGIPTQNLYLMMILGVASAIGLSIFLFTGSGLIGIIGAGFVIYVGTRKSCSWRKRQSNSSIYKLEQPCPCVCHGRNASV